MKTTITIDDQLYEKAIALADDDTDKADIFTAAIKVFVQLQSAKRLAALGGQLPVMDDIARRSDEA